VLRALRAGDVQAADSAVQALTRARPQDPRSWSLDSDVATLRGELPRALASAERACSLGSTDFRDVIRRARALHALHRPEAAHELLDTLAARPPHAAVLAAVGDLQVEWRDYPRAHDAYDRAVQLQPRNPRHWFNRAAVRRYLGRLIDAEADYDQALALEPRDAEAQLNRSQLRTQTQSQNHLAELTRWAEQGFDTWQSEVAIRYALAKELEDLGNFAQSFLQLARGASVRRQHLRYDVRVDVATADHIIQAFPGTASGTRGCESAAPIFIVGMPRTGSTLIERMLASDEAVHSAGELTDFGLAVVSAVQQSLGRRNIARQELVAASARLDFAALGSDYLERTRPWRADGAQFIDKLPINYLYCGLIARALPRARIVHVTRHPLATGYAIFKTLFNQGYPFSYDLEELGAYYGSYYRLMQHWRERLPGVIHEIAYERLIEDPEGESRRLFGALGLTWSPRCLEFHRSSDAVATASAVQVRRPLYRSSLDQWRHYEAQLAPLRARLLAEGVPVDP